MLSNRHNFRQKYILLFAIVIFSILFSACSSYYKIPKCRQGQHTVCSITDSLSNVRLFNKKWSLTYYSAPESSIQYHTSYPDYSHADTIDDYITFAVVDTLKTKNNILQKTRVTDCSYMSCTQDFTYFIIRYGSAIIHTLPVKGYSTGILLINRSHPQTFRGYVYQIKEVVYTEQTNNEFRVITVDLKPVITIAGRIGKWITPHQWIGEYVSKEIYREYRYNLNLEQVSLKTISKKEVEILIENCK